MRGIENSVNVRVGVGVSLGGERRKRKSLRPQVL